MKYDVLLWFIEEMEARIHKIILGWLILTFSCTQFLKECYDKYNSISIFVATNERSSIIEKQIGWGALSDLNVRAI